MKIEEKTFYGAYGNFLQGMSCHKFRIQTSNMTVINTINIGDMQGGDDAYYCPTLKDLSIFLYEMCGQGVTWQFLRELSEKTGFDIHKLDEAINSIIEEYANISDEEAIRRWVANANHIKK